MGKRLIKGSECVMEHLLFSLSAFIHVNVGISLCICGCVCVRRKEVRGNV